MYIANKGITQTKIYNNNKQMSEKDLKWNAKYDGKNADLDVEMNNDGEKKNLYMKFNNEDLAEILNVPSVGEDLYKRIKNDYKISNRTSFQNKKNPSLQPDIHEFHNKLMKKYSPSTRSYYKKKYSRKYTIRKQNNLNKNKKTNKPKTMRFF